MYRLSFSADHERPPRHRGVNFKMKQYILMHIIIMTAHTLLVSTALITNGMATVLKPIELLQLLEQNTTTFAEEDFTSSSPLSLLVSPVTNRPPALHRTTSNERPANHIIVPANNIVVGQNVDDVIILSSQPLRPPVDQPRPIPNVYVESAATQLIDGNKKSTTLLNSNDGFLHAQEQNQRWPVIVGINCFQSRIEIALNRTVMQQKLIKAALASTTNTQLFFSSLNDLRFEVLYPAQPTSRSSSSGRYCKSSFYAVGHVDLGIVSVNNPHVFSNLDATDEKGVPESLPLVQQIPPLQYNAKRKSTATTTTRTTTEKLKRKVVPTATQRSRGENFDFELMIDSAKLRDATPLLPFMWASDGINYHTLDQLRHKNSSSSTTKKAAKKNLPRNQIPAALRSSPPISSSSLLNDDNVILHNLWHQANNADENSPEGSKTYDFSPSASDNCGVDDVYLVGNTRVLQFTLLVRTKTSRQIAQADASEAAEPATETDQQPSQAPQQTTPSNFYFERMLELTGNCAYPTRNARSHHGGSMAQSTAAKNGEDGAGVGHAVFEKTVRVDSGDASAQDVHIFFSMPVVVPGAVARDPTQLFPPSTFSTSSSMHDVEQISIGVPLRIGMELKNRQKYTRMLPLKCLIGEYHVGTTSTHTISALFGKDEFQENSKPGLPPIRVRHHVAATSSAGVESDPILFASPRLIPIITDECSDIPSLIQPSTQKFVMDPSGTRFKIDFRSFKFTSPSSRGQSSNSDFWSDSVKRILNFPLGGSGGGTSSLPLTQSDGLFVGCVIRTCTESVDHLCLPDEKCFEQPNNKRFRTAGTPSAPQRPHASVVAQQHQTSPANNNRTNNIRSFAQRLDHPATERCNDLLEAIDAQAAKEQLIWSKVLVIGGATSWQNEAQSVDIAVDSAAFTIDQFPDEPAASEVQNVTTDVHDNVDIYATKLNLLYQLVDGGETLCFPLLPFTILATVFALTILLSLALALLFCLLSRRYKRQATNKTETKTATKTLMQSQNAPTKDIVTGATSVKQTIPKFVRPNVVPAPPAIAGAAVRKSSLAVARDFSATARASR